ncbi:MAG TPA: response regulator [Ignavibacteriaceae bacterium]|nr:response regulator [Ignavibacteriaceae bacterium]
MNNPDGSLKVMVVEDEFIIALDIKERLNKLGYKVPGIATTGREAVRIANKVNPNIILMDIMLRGEMDGVQAAKLIREKLDIPVLFISSFSDIHSVQRAEKVSPFGYIVKPFTEIELKSGIEKAYTKFQLGKKFSNQRKAESI